MQPIQSDNTTFKPIPALSTIDTEAQPQLGQSPEEIRTPSFGLSMDATTYSALHEGTTANVLTWLQTRVVEPDITDSARPYLSQDKVNTLWKDAGIPDAAPDATKYNDVGIYTLIDKAKHRQAARDIDEATQGSITGSTARGATTLALSMVDPLNALAGFFPAAGLARVAGFAGTAAKIETVSALGTTAETLAGRVGARAASGAIEGFAGNIPIEVVTAPMRSEMGEDYTAADSMKNILLGSAVGGGLHVAVGSLGRINPKVTPEGKIETNFGGDVTTKVNEMRNTDFNSAAKISEASEMIKPLSEDSVVRSDLNNAVDYLRMSEEEKVNATTNPESVLLSDYIKEPGTTSRMLSETLDRYNELVSAKKDATEFNRANLMQEAIDNTKRTTFDTTMAVTPATRENAAKIAMAQGLDEKFPTVDNLLKADKNIGEATQADVIRDIKQGQSDYKNSFVTMEAKKIPPPEAIPYEGKITLDESIARSEAKIAEMEKLQEAGILYSKDVSGKNTPDVLAKDGDNIPRFINQEIASRAKDRFGTEIVAKNADELIIKSPDGYTVRMSDKPIEGDSAKFSKEVVLTPEEKARLSTLNQQEFDKYVEDLFADAKLKTAEIKNSLVKEFGSDADNLLKAGKIEIVENVKDLPGIHPDNVKGMTITSKGKVYLVARNLTPEQVRGVVLHEVGVHTNIADMVGTTGYSNLLKQVDSLLKDEPALNDLLDAVVPKDTPSHLIAEEKLAYLVENATRLPMVQAFLAKVKAWLFTTFPSLQKSLKLNQGDIAAIALSSLRNYARKDTVKTARANGDLGIAYSQMADVVDNVQRDLAEVNKLLKQVDNWRAGLKTIADDLADIDDVETFRTQFENTVGRISPEAAKEVKSIFDRALDRYRENNSMNPASDAVDYTMNQLKDSWLKEKKSLVWDSGVKTRIAKFLDTMTDLPEDGVKSLTIGTTVQRKGTQQFNAALAIKTIEDRYMSEFENNIIQAKLDDALLSKGFDDDIMRAMEAIQKGDDTKLKALSPESQKIAHIIEDNYNSMLKELNDTGLTVDKIDGYFFNQIYMHDQDRIFNAGREAWVSNAKRLFDIDKMAEELNMKKSDFNDEFWNESYKRFSTGRHNDVMNTASVDADTGDVVGGYGGFNSNDPFRSITTKERKYHFKDVEAAIEYKKLYGNKSLLAGVAGTVRANARKLGITRTLGVNYERNLNELSRYLEGKVVIPEQLEKFRKINHDLKLQIQAIDGRADMPISGMLARFGANSRSILSMTMLSKAGIAGMFGDPMNAAIQDVKLGVTKMPLPLQYIKRFFENIKRYSPEQKAVVRSMGIGTENFLMDAYRYDSMENNVSGVLARAQRWFFKLNLIDKQGSATKTSSAAMIGSAHAGFVKMPFEELSAGARRYLERYNINKEEWQFLSKTELVQADGKEYLVPAKVKELKNEALAIMKSKGVADNVADIAASKYVDDLSNRLSMYYRDLVARQYLEPDQTSKYYNSWKGAAKKGTPAGEAIQFAMQFKQYGINFWRNVILDEVYSRHDTAGEFGKSLATDWSGAGIKQKYNILNKLASYAFAGVFVSSVYDIMGGRKPRVMSLLDGKDRTAKNMFDIFFTGLYRSGGLGFLSDYLFTDYSRYGQSLAGALAGPAAGRVGELIGLAQGGAAGTYKLLNNEKATDTKARWLRFAKGLMPSTFYSTIAANYLFWYGIQEKLNPGYLNRMERQMKKLSDQEFIAPPSRYAIRY